GLPLAYILTAGNQALVGTSEMALTLLDDPRVTTLGMYVEGFDLIESMEKLAQKSRDLKKPVVIYKVGKSEHSQQAAMTHTGSLAGPHNITSAFLKRYGFGQAESIPAFLETLKLLHVHGPLAGYRITSMSCSGGEASIIADAAGGRKVYFDELTVEQKAPIEVALGPLVTVANPLDYHTYCWGNREVMEAAYSGMVGNGFDMNLLILDFPHRERCDDWEWMIAVDAYEAALKKNSAKGAIVVGMPENISEGYTESFIERGIVSLYGIDDALTATEIAADIGVAWRQSFPAPALKLNKISGKTITLDEAAAKQQLSEHGVTVPQGERLTSAGQGKEIAGRVGFPVVLKALGIAHKTESDAVRLNLNSADEIGVAATDLFKLSDTLYLEHMVQSPVAELIVGVTRDAQFGLVITIGSGGILVEILKDTQTLIIPAQREQIENAILSLKSAPLLQGYRGKAKADLRATVDAIIAIQAYAISQSNSLVELDVNPLLLCAEAKGVFAADALIVLEEK
ncbi:MAG: acetate--CoA ligase family protein, partial [Gammaproteobacteria bacterium]|nr:acetate--CoA ligase family protein [Gammaproteobacteria bacterium]